MPKRKNKCKYNLRIRHDSHVSKYKEIESETNDMRPYKKRSFYSNVHNNDNIMETENSDESDKQMTPPPASEDMEKEKDKDKDGETKSRKKWKRKISRKQFRHHDIKLFTPGEYRTSTFLRQKDMSPNHPKKFTGPNSKETITESIVNSLGGQRQVFAQKPIEETTEENNNTSGAENHNSAGKHQLPAIVKLTPTIMRRQSLDVPKQGFLKNPHEVNTRKPYVVNSPLEDNPVSSSKENVQNEHLEFSTSHWRQGNAMPRDNNMKNKTLDGTSVLQPVETDEPENLSLKRRDSETPVDLSKRKNSGTQTVREDTSSLLPNSNGSVIAESKAVSVQSSPQKSHDALACKNHVEPLKPSHNSQQNDVQINNNSSKGTNISNDLQASSQNYSLIQNSQKMFYNTVAKVTMYTLKMEHLQRIMAQQFNVQTLNNISRCYLELNEIKEDVPIPAEVKLQTQKVLDEAQNYVANKMKMFYLEVNPIEIIKILGQSEPSIEKKTLLNELENIQCIRNLQLNDHAPFNQQSTNKFVPPQYNYRDKGPPTSPPHPPLYMSNFSHTTKAPPFRTNNFSSQRVFGDVHVAPYMQRLAEIRFKETHPLGPTHHSVPSNNIFNRAENNLSEIYPPPSYVPHYMASGQYFNKPGCEARPKNVMERPRSKSYRHNEAARGQPLKRSISNPQDNSYPLRCAYNGNASGIPITPNPHILSAKNIPQNGGLSVTSSDVVIDVPQHRMAIGTNKYSPLLPKEYPNNHSVQVNVNRPVVVNNKQNSTTKPNNLFQKACEIQCPKVPVTFNSYIEDNITSTTDHLETPKVEVQPTQQVHERKKLTNSKTTEFREKSVPAVIVADTSMQITKEPTSSVLDAKKHQGLSAANDLRMTVITSSSVKEPSLQDEKKSCDKDQDENNLEFLIWLQKLKSDEKLKSKFLSQMGILKKDKPVFKSSSECIEIIDSDEEKPIKITKIDPDSQIVKIPIVSRESTPTKETLTYHDNSAPQRNDAAVPHTKTTVPVSSFPRARNPSPKQSLSKLDYIPPIALPYTPKVTEPDQQLDSKDEKKTIYSPEIEPISPVGNETSFKFPEVRIANKSIPSAVPINLGERRVRLGESPTSPPYIHKRNFSDYHNKSSSSPNHAIAENTSKRRKSLERPQNALSPRVAPSGKLCYVRESHLFLRYFDDTQVELFIKNLSSQDEELLRTTGIDPEKIKNTYKSSNFGLEHLVKTEIIQLPRDIEFSRKADLPDVEEFVKESNLVEQFVPKDFANFYRYVTGFQIIKKKHPVSLQTFLTMYNTNRTTELLRKYLQRRDEDASGVVR